MNKDGLNVGDIVYLNVAKENRDWGYHPGPDGTKCEVISFDLESGSGGLNKYWPTVRFLDGEKRGETERILTLHLSENHPQTEVKAKQVTTLNGMKFALEGLVGELENEAVRFLEIEGQVGTDKANSQFHWRRYMSRKIKRILANPCELDRGEADG